MAQHTIVALALSGVVAFDLATVGQVFDHADMRDHYRFDACGRTPRPVTASFKLTVDAGLDALDGADTVVVPGYLLVQRLTATTPIAWPTSPAPVLSLVRPLACPKGLATAWLSREG